MASYAPRSIKRSRRTREEMDSIRLAIYAVLESFHPMTVRQCFYQLVSRGIIAKTEAEYKQTVVRLLTAMRRGDQVSFDWISDNTRWMRKPTTYGSVEEMLEYCQRTYRRSIWNDQNVYVEVWCEKDALAGVLYMETERWDVSLMVTRGYPSITESISPHRGNRRLFTISETMTHPVWTSPAQSKWDCASLPAMPRSPSNVSL